MSAAIKSTNDLTPPDSNDGLEIIVDPIACDEVEEEEIIVNPSPSQEEEEEIIVHPSDNEDKKMGNQDVAQPCDQRDAHSQSVRTEASGQKHLAIGAIPTLRGIEKNRGRISNDNNNANECIPTLRGLGKNATKRAALQIFVNEVDCDELAESIDTTSYHTRRLGDSKEKRQAELPRRFGPHQAIDCDELAEQLNRDSLSTFVGSHHVAGGRPTGVTKETKRQAMSKHRNIPIRSSPGAWASDPGGNHVKPSFLQYIDGEKAEAKRIEKLSYAAYLETSSSDSESENGLDHQSNQPIPESHDEEDVEVFPSPGARSEDGAQNDRIHDALLESFTTTTQDGGDEQQASDSYYNNGLVEALPVQDADNSGMMEAQPVPRNSLYQQAAREAKEKKHRKIACGIVAIACLVLAVSLAVRLTRKNESNEVVGDREMPPAIDGATRPLPPMENLELLYEDLPIITKENLYNSDSPQYRAWAWLLNHPDVANLEEWRKKQIFAMATLFYSFEGPNWPEASPSIKRWMDSNTNECSWVLSDDEAAYIYQQSINVGLRPDAYEEQDYKSCNKEGQLQVLGLQQLYLPANTNPSIPPEIVLLTSLRIFGIFFSRVNAKLSDLLLPVIQVPSLELLFIRSTGIRGTIPKQLGTLTGLRHLLISDNDLSGTIPSAIAGMTSLEHINLGDEENLTGELPTELGLMTRLNGLEIYRSSVRGTIPSEVGLLTHMRELSLDGNMLTGSIPTELGLLTGNTWLALYSNQLNGPIPSQLGLMSNTIRLRAWSNLHPVRVGIDD